MSTQNTDQSKILEIIKQYFTNRPDTAVVYLFGSATGGNFTAESDVDIGVYYKKGQAPDGLILLGEQQELSDLLNRPVDLVALNRASPILNYQVLKNGQRVLCPDERAANEFFVRTLNEYFDLKRNREVIEKSLVKARII